MTLCVYTLEVTPLPFENLIQERLARRAANLLTALDDAKSIDHGPTKGQIREAVIRDSIIPLAPPNLATYTGFVLDAYGAITPQLDIIFARNESLSPVLLEGDAALVPIETFALSIEVKSRLTTKHLREQIGKQSDALREMQHTGVVPGQPECIKTFQTPTPICIIAHTSNVAVATMQKFVEENPSVPAIDVISGKNRCLVRRGNDPVINLTDHQVIMEFWKLIFVLALTRNRRPSLNAEQQKQLEEEHQQFRPDLSLELFSEMVFTPSFPAYLSPPKRPGVDNDA